MKPPYVSHLSTDSYNCTGAVVVGREVGVVCFSVKIDAVVAGGWLVGGKVVGGKVIGGSVVSSWVVGAAVVSSPVVVAEDFVGNSVVTVSMESSVGSCSDIVEEGGTSCAVGTEVAGACSL